jgi:Ala-tRNA(Pro) deacylase
VILGRTALASREDEGRCSVAVNERLGELLARRGVKMNVMRHRDTFTAQEAAHASHTPGRMFAKVVVLRDLTGGYLMAVIPASERLDLDAISVVSGLWGLELATEAELARLFPDCEPGSEPPFGHLYGMPMYVDSHLANQQIYFQVGNHHDVAMLPYETYAQLARPFQGDVCLHIHPMYVHYL